MSETRASWISPEDVEHKLPPQTSDNWFYTHLDWVADNHKKHVDPKHWAKHVGSDGRWNGESEIVEPQVVHSMMKSGWIRKADKDAYHVGRQEDVGRVMSHVRRHHPEVDTIRVDVDHKRWDKTGTSGVYRIGSVAAYRETADSLIGKVLGEATLRPHGDNRPGRARYDIEHEGQRIGNLAVMDVDHAPGLPAGARAGKLGVRLNPDARGSRTLVRDVLRQIRDRHPDLTHVGGFRLSGTRAHWDNDQKKTTDRYTWVKLR